MKRKIYLFLGLFFTLAVISIISKEISRVIKNKADKKQAVQTELDASGEEADKATDTDSDVACYSYDEVEDMVKYLSDSEDTLTQLARLVDPLSKSNKITVSYVKNVARIIGVPDTVYEEQLGDRDEDAFVSCEEFDAIYHNMVDTDVVNGLDRKNVLIFETEYVDETVVVNDGNSRYTFGTDYMEEFENRLLDVYVKNDVIFKVNGFATGTVILKHVWVDDVQDGMCTFVYKGMEKTYPLDAHNLDAKAGRIATLYISDAGISRVDMQYTSIQGRVLSADEKIQMQDKAPYEMDEDFAIYDTASLEVLYEESLELLKGYPSIKLVLKDGKACAAILDGERAEELIRVILSDSDFVSYEFETVTVSCKGDFKVTYPNDEEISFAKGKTVTINCEDYDNRDKIVISPVNPQDGIIIENIIRECGKPVYGGTIEINVKSDCLYIINELPLENYLYGVVSSEAPKDFEPEALAALAICARAYAYGKMHDGSFNDYGADLDDSTFRQMYNNVLKTEESIKAVKDTYGIVPVYDEKVIFPMYFSTSCGMTCTNDEIWGGTAYDYMVSNIQDIKKSHEDLSDEERFEEFIKNGLGYDMIECKLPYYRWDISFTDEEIGEAVNNNLGDRISMSPDNIKVKNDKDEFVKKEIKDIGDIKNITVTERSESGIVLAMEIEGSEETIRVTGQTNIRNLISPINQNIERNDGSVVAGWTSLPSTFYYVEKIDGGFTIHGGGFGHGSGLSQNGANVLAQMGYNYKYIIRYYFSYVDLEMIYDVQDAGEEE
ncbi:MAG: SpoIID/LytB domain-containing protein [Clostridium sp.]|nr:SpoIID/LytB domain-containing protein [Clostridium sp.]MCM1398445.1 SpoIID/LytB domain-containing protein [Clostridium sp.]MCM1458890.1 SpoIID/LytB domain-containing protein [Bacteroides sp.]